MKLVLKASFSFCFYPEKNEKTIVFVTNSTLTLQIVKTTIKVICLSLSEQLPESGTSTNFKQKRLKC